MRSKAWLTGYLWIVLILLCAIGAVIYYIDPYFHYHYPHTEKYFYVLSKQRYQNDGIIKHFDYDAVISGTSMTEQFKTSEMDAWFGTQSIKIPFSGASYKEINDNLKNALKCQPEAKMVVRGLDMNRFFDARDTMYYEPQDYPVYLYNENPFDDVKYLFNRDVMVDAGYMVFNAWQGWWAPGIPSFDEYGAGQDAYTWGINTVCPDGIRLDQQGRTGQPLTNEEKRIIQENIDANVISIADEYPNVTFYYFFTPYSAVWWSGVPVNRQTEAEQYIIELILEHNNIRLYSFNNRADITTDLNNYKDKCHYATWINSLMLKWMHDGEYLLTKENYMDYLEKERAFYTEFDYESLNGQEDYERDYYAAALLNWELCGVEPLGLEILVADALIEGTVVDAPQIFVQNIDEYKYLVLYGRNVEDGQILAQIFDAQGEVVSELTADDTVDVSSEWHQYLLDISDVEGDVTICFNGNIAEGETLSYRVDSLNAVLRDIYLY